MQQATSVNRHDDLKILALITMLIDHTGLLFFPSDMLFRTIGRIAFPIFAWQLVEGFCHTSNLKNYMTRIALFGCIAQLPYMFLSPELDFEPLRINILFQLLSGLALLWCAKKLQETVSSDKQRLHIPLVILLVLSILLLILLPDFISCYTLFQFEIKTREDCICLILQSKTNTTYTV